MIQRFLGVHAHREVVHVGISITEPPRLQELRARAKKRLDDLSIPPWEPYGQFPTKWRIDVAQTWKDHGWQPRS